MFIFTILLIFILSSLYSCDKQSEEIGLFSSQLDTDLNIDSEYIVVIGDIQLYTYKKRYEIYYERTMNWILSQYFSGINFKCILQMGDITNNNSEYQYNIFYKHTLPVAQYIPYIACIGNHDYTWDANQHINGRNQTMFSDFTSFKLTNSLVVARFEENRMENIIVKTDILGVSYYILSLEFGPRTEVLEWANNFVMQHNDEKFILMTHEFLTSKGKRISSDCYAKRQLINTTCSSPEEVWNELVNNNNNIVCVLCGHSGFFTYQLSENMDGRSVPQILFNLQNQQNGGNGLIQLWEFSQNSDSSRIRIYNTVLQEWDINAGELEIRYKY